jgi:AsmA protein
MKKALWIGAAVFIFLLAAILVAPAFVDLAVFKRTYLPLIEDALHRRVDVGEVRLGLIPAPSIRLANLKVADSPAFPGNTFFAARQIELRLKFWPLIRGRFEVTEFILEKPVINLLRQPDGTFNYSDLTGKKSPLAKNADAKRKRSEARTQEPVAAPFLVPTRMRINDGQLNLETKGQKPLRINGIDLSLQEFADDRPFPYRLSFSYPGLKTISLEGLLSYQDEQATLKLKENRLKVQDLVLPVEGSVTHLSTVPRVNLSLSSDPVDAKPVFQILSVFGLAPSDTAVSGPMGLRLTVSGPSNNLSTEIRGQFKDVRVEGKRALRGNLSGNVFIKLPLGGGAVTRRLQGNGRVVARDGELTNVDLIKKIQRVTGMIGLSKEQGREATTFKTLETDFVVGDGLAVFERLYLMNPQMEVTGGGTLTLDQPALKIAIETTLSPQASVRAAGGRATTFFKDNQGRIVVPLKITGPVENPAVNLDTEKLAQRGMTRSLEKGAGSFFQRFFRK